MPRPALQPRDRRVLWLTHVPLVVLTGVLFALVLALPFAVAFFPAAVVSHRVGVLLHEYLHGIPFRRASGNHRVLNAWGGLLLFGGLLELFRGTHLAHHRWLNRPGDPGVQSAEAPRPRSRLLAWLFVLEGIQHLTFLGAAFRGRYPLVRPRAMALEALQSAAWVAFWVAIGEPWMPAKIWALIAYNTLVPISLRGAVEHHGPRGARGSANEYRPLLPLFNLNRHIHHHEEPTRPWYRLEYRTGRPLPWTCYFTHWFHAYVKRDYVLLSPDA